MGFLGEGCRGCVGGFGVVFEDEGITCGCSGRGVRN